MIYTQCALHTHSLTHTHTHTHTSNDTDPMEYQYLNSLKDKNNLQLLSNLCDIGIFKDNYELKASKQWKDITKVSYEPGVYN